MGKSRVRGFGVPEEWKDLQRICREVLRSADAAGREEGREVTVFEARLRDLLTKHVDDKGKWTNDRTVMQTLQYAAEMGFVDVEGEEEPSAKGKKLLGIVLQHQVPRPVRVVAEGGKGSGEEKAG